MPSRLAAASAVSAALAHSVGAQCPNHPHLDLCPANLNKEARRNKAKEIDVNRGARNSAWMALVLPFMAARPSFSTGLAVMAVAVMAADARGYGSSSMSCGHIRTFYQAQDCCSEGEEPLSLDFSTSEGSSFGSSVCGATSPVGVCHCARAMQLLSQVPGVQFPAEFCGHMAHVKPVGFHDQPICEASDAGTNAEFLVDGRAGNTNFPHGNIKVLATAGEVDPLTGSMLTGVPDGLGAYLKDADTVRLIYQSEAYGQLVSSNPESYPWTVNSNTASFTGSHIHFIDYDRSMLATFMDDGAPAKAQSMVKGAGNAVTTAYNLRRELVGPRNRAWDGLQATRSNVHESNVDVHGNYIVGSTAKAPSKADWLMQSLCSAHLEVRHQWGNGKGVEDDLFITNEEWIIYPESSLPIGLPVHVLNLATGELWATAAFTLGGHEKVVEVNSGHQGYVAFVPSGYNGAFGISRGAVLDARNSLYSRTDGNPYVWPQDIVPTKLYIGKKNTDKEGNADSIDFLARNGFEHGDTVRGAFYKLRWQAQRGVVRGFEHDGSWEFQDAPRGAPAGWCFWNSNGKDRRGAKTEHVSPDPRGGQRVLQGSTAGYFGIYDFSSLPSLLGSSFPDSIPATYTVYQPESDVRNLIELGGAGIRADGNNQKMMRDSSRDKSTFEDVDGMEWIAAADGQDYFIIHEDGGNWYGERKFLAKVGIPMKYYFVAQSGGRANTRELAGVSSVAGVHGGAGSHEFSGAFDLSGLLRKDASGNFALPVKDVTGKKRELEAATPINEKTIAVNLQAHTNRAGFAVTFGSDRVSQDLLFRLSVSIDGSQWASKGSAGYGALCVTFAQLPPLSIGAWLREAGVFETAIGKVSCRMSVAVPRAVRFTTCEASPELQNAPLASFGPCGDSEHIGAARSSWRMPRSGGRDGFDFSFLTNRDDSQGFIAEEDRVNCPFYFKIGACRNGDRCNRAHSKPTSGNTILIPHLYPCIPEAMAVANDDEWDDETYARQQEHLEHFYEEVFLELAKFGEAMVALCEDAEYRGQLSAWLQKKKSGTSAFRMREYNKRYFTLDFDTHTFFYAHSEGSSKVSAVTPFADIVDVRMPEADLKGDNISEFSKGSKRSFLQRTTSFLKTAKEAEEQHVLTVMTRPAKTMELMCSSATEASTWFEALKTAIAMDREQATEAGHTTASASESDEKPPAPPLRGGYPTPAPAPVPRGHKAVAQPVKKLKEAAVDLRQLFVSGKCSSWTLAAWAPQQKARRSQPPEPEEQEAAARNLLLELMLAGQARCEARLRALAAAPPAPPAPPAPDLAMLWKIACHCLGTFLGTLRRPRRGDPESRALRVRNGRVEAGPGESWPPVWSCTSLAGQMQLSDRTALRIAAENGHVAVCRAND
ncbi:Splicing factor U2af small subunit B [Symbiodinium microadriaticum]|uniref:Splicing factor U2af small subunit B n=1 Tax=Symbiodinium microadriaticum TaxID=2951 RepID=A0A1Q9F0Z8_SYMMI|nr:Splicing factor U2af small subunit B [Symbiodinium microadriaticum]